MAGFGGALLILLSAAVLVNTILLILIQICPIDSNIFIPVLVTKYSNSNPANRFRHFNPIIVHI